MKTNIVDWAGKQLEKHKHKGFLSYVIYIMIFTAMVLVLSAKWIGNFLFSKKLKHQ